LARQEESAQESTSSRPLLFSGAQCLEPLGVKADLDLLLADGIITADDATKVLSDYQEGAPDDKQRPLDELLGLLKVEIDRFAEPKYTRGESMRRVLMA